MADGDDINKDLLQKAQGSIYMEEQVDAWCALHAVNGVLQGPRYCLQDFVEKARELEKAQLTVHHSANGDFSLDTIVAVLGDASIPLQPYIKEEIAVMLENQDCPLHHVCQGLFIHSPTRDHWYSMKIPLQLVVHLRH